MQGQPATTIQTLIEEFQVVHDSRNISFQNWQITMLNMSVCDTDNIITGKEDIFPEKL